MAEAFDILWYELAKEGKESAAFAPLARYPNTSFWMVQSMAGSSDFRNRKLGAMLAGWITDPKYLALLREMLQRERGIFAGDSLNANSVGEDIMFAATRWTESEDSQTRSAGIDILAGMIRDALHGTPWNTVNWAIGNLHHATQGKHEVFQELANATDSQMEGQKFLQNAVIALRQNDQHKLARLYTPPATLSSLNPDDAGYSVVANLWMAAAQAEASINWEMQT
jgi:hypothetical protein